MGRRRPLELRPRRCRCRRRPASQGLAWEFKGGPGAAPDHCSFLAFLPFLSSPLGAFGLDEARAKERGKTSKPIEL